MIDVPSLAAASDVRAWPSLSQAARYLGVDKATLSRRSDLQTVRVGRQEQRLSPAAVMRLAREYRRRVVDEVAFELVEHARVRVPDQVPTVEQEIDAVLAAGSSAAQVDPASFLAMAQSYLPRDLYELVLEAVSVKLPSSQGVVGEDPNPARPEPAPPGPGRRSRRNVPSHAVPA
jgi:hypothetical protein